MESRNFFLSHFSEDKEIAEIIANILKRVSLEQIQPSYSSDSSPTGGLNPGSQWFAEILSKLKSSNALIAIITPNSIFRPWLYFESGIAQAVENCEVIPVCVGISKENVYPPLGAYQIYQLSDYRALRDFIGKLLNKFSVKFDEELTKPFVERAIRELSSIQFKDVPADPKLREVLNDLKSHVDKRFLELWGKPTLHITATDNICTDILIKDIQFSTQEEAFATVTLRLEIKLSDYVSEQFIEIRNTNSFADMTLAIYYLISDHVKPYSYLETWILRDKENGKNLVIKEIQDYIPAVSILKRARELEVISLEKPYNASDFKISE